MSMSLADARFLFDRALGLIRRGMASLHTRGWRASWQRVRVQLRPGRADAAACRCMPGRRRRSRRSRVPHFATRRAPAS